MPQVEGAVIQIYDVHQNRKVAATYSLELYSHD